ncbi:hypothetical protein ANOM_007381 [Aspergillus nomiae NRRL 13137]|uniref:Methyltransferase type 12 domain-containing protein n=1 Tax=Aspergillus nomiae NRRL (strain ATCC 15546 / NRRL 13137 / CBS 260.88 / M93) TaxID=1509407 RepID=A0A0L1IWJ3_ASPN3|nr:uncharacterized protein ANOM_007381 [Aspergillus nomiae NRRL 13137]KNG83785.1 hypothetical protein ANOM_007381 [Aspergillus nomiae NRRL 13137]
MRQSLPQSARTYNWVSLCIYDFVVHYLATRFAWRCPTDSVLIPFFRANAGPRHMDVGVGTGYFLAAMKESPGEDPALSWPQKLVLVDLNPTCIKKAATRIALPDRTDCLVADVLKPLPDSLELGTFDSISIMFLLHCLPGPPSRKATTFVNLKSLLKEHGVLFGTTVLGKNIRYNWFASLLLSIYNFFGVFDNYGDEAKDFTNLLSQEFDHVESVVVGCVLIFKATSPRKA